MLDDIQQTVQSARKQDRTLDGHCIALEQAAGLSFTDHFSVSIAGALLPVCEIYFCLRSCIDIVQGLSHTDTRGIALELLSKFKGLGVDVLRRCTSDNASEFQTTVSAVLRADAETSKALGVLFGAIATTLSPPDIVRMSRLLGKCAVSSNLVTVLPHARITAALQQIGAPPSQTAAATTALAIAAAVNSSEQSFRNEQGLNELGPFQVCHGYPKFSLISIENCSRAQNGLREICRFCIRICSKVITTGQVKCQMNTSKCNVILWTWFCFNTAISMHRS